MKKILILLALICTFFTSAYAETDDSAGKNLIPNNDFTVHQKYKKIKWGVANSAVENNFTYWDSGFSGVNCEISQEEAYEDKNSLKVTKNVHFADVRTPLVNVKKGVRYLISVNVKAEKGTSGDVNLKILHQLQRTRHFYDRKQYPTSQLLGNTHITDEWTTLSAIYTGDFDTLSQNIRVKIIFEDNKADSVGKTYYINNPQIIPLEERVDDWKRDSAAFRSEVYVDVKNGSDKNSGTKNAPYKTLEHARDEVRKFNKNMPSDITVYIKGGEYVLDKSFKLNIEDSGTNGHKIIYKAYNDEKVSVSGGRKITGWKLHDAEKGIYAAKAGFDLETRQFYVNGERAIRARSYDLTGMYAVEEGIITTNREYLNVKNASDTELCFTSVWTFPRVDMKEFVERDDGTVLLKANAETYKGARNKGQTSVALPDYIENAYEFLDEPGEWYLDRPSDTIYYIPRMGEDIQTAECVVPVLEELVGIKGESECDVVENIQFDGISFEYSTYLRPNDYGNVDAQGNNIRDGRGNPDWVTPGSIMVEYAHSISFMNCEFSKIGHNAVEMIDGIKNCVIDGNKFWDISSCAIVIGEVYWDDFLDYMNYEEAYPEYIVENNVITNNFIYNVAKEYKSAVGIDLGFTRNTVVEHNEIYDVPYSGMHIGYGWDNIPTTYVRDLKINYNYIEKVQNDKLYDGGGVYNLGPSSATTEDPNELKYNYFKIINNEGNPIYYDNGSYGWRAEKNVMDNKDGVGFGYHQTGPKWFGSVHPIWEDYAISNYTNVHQYVFGSFSDTPEHSMVKDTVYCPYEWPDEAKKIIAESGVTEKYKDLYEKVPHWIEYNGEVKLAVGESKNADIKVTGAKSVQLTSDDVEIVYGSRDENVAKVSQDGTITAVGVGSTKIDIMARNKGVTLRREITVYCDDVPVELVPDTFTPNVLKGSSISFEFYGKTKFGDKCDVENVTCEVKNPEIAEYKDGKVYGKKEGETTLRFKAFSGGYELTKDFDLKVIDYVTANPTKYKVFKADELINDAGNWSGGSSSGSGVTTAGRAVTYNGKKYLNEIFAFDLKLDDTSWPSIVFRVPNKGEDVSRGTGYIIVLSGNGYLELQRFNGGERTVIFGTLSGGGNRRSTGGPRWENPAMLCHTEAAHVEVGAINEKDGVRLILTINGIRVFDYLDTASARIENEGYFGVIAPNGTATITATGEYDREAVKLQTEEKIAQAEKEIAGNAATETDSSEETGSQMSGFIDTQNHWAKDVIAEVKAAGTVKGVSDDEFAPDLGVTSGEYVSMLLRWFKNEIKGYSEGSFSGYMSNLERGWINDAIAEVDSLQETYNEENYLKQIEFIKKRGWITDELLSQGFAFDEKLTREKVAALTAIVYRSYMNEKEVYGSIEPYADSSDISDWASDGVRELKLRGVMVGDDNNMFNPKQIVTRAEAAAIISEMMKIVYKG